MPLTRQQLRDFDRRAVEEWGVPSLILMENAGRSTADVIERWRAGVTELGAGRDFAIVAGVGNNGGDGFVIARHLHLRRHGVCVFVVGDRAKLTADAATNLQIIERLGLDVRWRKGDQFGKLSEELEGWDLVIDALGGTGISGPLRGELALAVEQINAARKWVVAVDIPTGLDCDTGQAHPPTIRAQLTVTMVDRKVGFAAPGADLYTGEVVVVDIGVPIREH